MTCLLPGSPGRAPFAGHVRGARDLDGVRLAWAGRIAATASPDEAWLAADALRDVLTDTTGRDREALIAAVGVGLRAIPAALRDRADLSLLLAVADARGILLMGTGFAQVLVDTEGGWLAAALPGSPLIGEPGFPEDWAVGQPPLRTGTRFLGLPTGLAVPTDAAHACGVRA